MKIHVLTDVELEAICQKSAALALESYTKAARENGTFPGDTGGQWLTKKEAAALLNCAPGTVDNFRRDGKLKVHRLGAKHVRFERSEVLEILNGKRR